MILAKIIFWVFAVLVGAACFYLIALFVASLIGEWRYRRRERKRHAELTAKIQKASERLMLDWAQSYNLSVKDRQAKHRPDDIEVMLRQIESQY